MRGRGTGSCDVGDAGVSSMAGQGILGWLGLNPYISLVIFVPLLPSSGTIILFFFFFCGLGINSAAPAIVGQVDISHHS